MRDNIKSLRPSGSASLGDRGARPSVEDGAGKKTLSERVSGKSGGLFFGRKVKKV